MSNKPITSEEELAKIIDQVTDDNKTSKSINLRKETSDTWGTPAILDDSKSEDIRENTSEHTREEYTPEGDTDGDGDVDGYDKVVSIDKMPTLGDISHLRDDVKVQVSPVRPPVASSTSTSSLITRYDNEPKIKPAAIHAIALPICAVAMAVALITGAIISWSGAGKATATVLGYSTITNVDAAGNIVTYDELVYEYEVKGDLYIGRVGLTPSSGYKVGDEIEIVYSDKDYRDSHIVEVS